MRDHGPLFAAHFTRRIAAERDQYEFINAPIIIGIDHGYGNIEEHKEFAAEKMNDLDYSVLTLAAIARELAMRDIWATYWRGVCGGRGHAGVGGFSAAAEKVGRYAGESDCILSVSQV